MANANKISLQIGEPSRDSGDSSLATGFRACPRNQPPLGPAGPVECSPGREAGVWKAQVGQPRRCVRAGLLESYAPPALYIFAYGYPGLTAGATLYRPSGPASSDYLDRLFSRWREFKHLSSAVGTKDICRAYGTYSVWWRFFHRLKPVATGLSPLSRLRLSIIWTTRSGPGLISPDFAEMDHLS
jgi:hypothetical protein